MTKLKIQMKGKETKAAPIANPKQRRDAIYSPPLSHYSTFPNLNFTDKLPCLPFFGECRDVNNIHTDLSGCGGYASDCYQVMKRSGASQNLVCVANNTLGLRNDAFAKSECGPWPELLPSTTLKKCNKTYLLGRVTAKAETQICVYEQLKSHFPKICRKIISAQKHHLQLIPFSDRNGVKYHAGIHPPLDISVRAYGGKRMRSGAGNL